jgi:tetratricopeptide (TPR) repeat protein
MIIQACIYAGFLIVTFIIAWRLALVIDHRVAVPIESISGYMKCGNPTLYMIQDSYNCQLNSILNNLRQIEIIEKMIDPLFLQDPITENRIKNLEIISELFKNIDNKRGWALVLNLLGNIKFLDKKMKEAEEHYRKALEVLELLMNELEVQEESESKLEDKEKQKLGILEDDCYWDEKKKLVLESIKDQQLQIIFAMSTRIKENGSGSFPLNRKKWKEIIKLYTKVLQFYMDSKENCADFLDLLIDLAEVFQILNYYHTAKGLLDIVQVDLSQLRSNHKSKIDIDSGRLQKFGLDIKESKKKEHFSVNPEQFELDILTQKLFYIKGKLNLDKENYHKAGKDFQQAIVRST